MKDKLKIFRVYPFMQSDMLYLEHYLSTILKLYGCSTLFISSNKMRATWAKFISDPTQFDKPYETYENYEIFRFKSISVAGQLIPTKPKKINNLIAKQKPDIIHLAGMSNLFNHIVIIIAILGKKNKPKIFYNDHSNPSELKESPLSWLYYKIHYLFFKSYQRSISKVIAPNTGSAELLKKRYSLKDEQLEIIPLGYDQNSYYHIPEEKNKEPYFIIGFAGKVEPRKKIERLIKAASQLKEKKIRIIVVGVNDKNEYIVKLQELASKNDVDLELRRFATNSGDLRTFYNYVNLCVFPGSISITTNEATACGTPVIIYNSIKGLEDRVDEGRGTLFSTDEELLDSIKVYMKEKIDNASIATATQKYSWHNVAKIYMKHYTNAITP